MPDIRRPRSNFRNRVNKMKGLPIDEKSLLLRMGELVDTAVNNRQTTGPGSDETVVGRQKRRRNRNVPQPINLIADVGTRGAILRWDKVDSPLLRNYRIRITPINDTGGAEFVATAFSNEYAFKGKGGDYKFEVQSIGRNGEGSEWSASIFFEISDTPIILEGNKFDVEELGAQISETVLTPLNYTAFVFASVVLDTFSDPNDNPSVTLELRHGDIYEQSVFVQQFELYPESEDLNNFDATVGINRPASSPGRSGTFNTTQSVMFTPYQILEGNPIADKNTRFWITVTNHGEDVVGLSCAIWVASEGLSEEDDTEEVVVHDKSIQLPALASGGLNRAFGISYDDSDAPVPTTTWTLNFWLKPEDLTTADFRIFHKSGFNLITGAPNNTQRILVAYDKDTPRLEVQVWNSAGTVSVLWTCDSQATVWPLGLNEWHMLTVAFDGDRSGSKFDVYVNGSVLTATSDNSTVTTIPDYAAISGVAAVGGIPTGNWLTRTTAVVNTGLFDGRIHAGGWWGIVLSSAAISAIYNSGNGATRNWLTSFGAYGSGADLNHYWRFGALDNFFIGPPAIDWLLKGTLATATQANVDFNVANDVSFDIGNMQDSDDHYRPMDFTNRIFIGFSFPGDDENRETHGGGAGSFSTDLVDSGDIVNDYPGL